MKNTKLFFLQLEDTVQTICIQPTILTSQNLISISKTIKTKAHIRKKSIN
jgi:hypothetical protein